MEKKPEWLRRAYMADETQQEVKDLLRVLGLNTVCREADCPNAMECYAKRTATFMILGTNCTRNCRFCNVHGGVPQLVDEDEPEKIALAVRKLGLRYVVVTSVTRDDLPDGGAAHFAAVIRAVKRINPETAIEVLIPDFKGNLNALRVVVDARPTVISHNMETVQALYTCIRPEAVYERSLAVIRSIKEMAPQIRSKSGIMVGLGENRNEIAVLMDDLRDAGCEFLTVGQYLRPSVEHYPVIEYIHPDQFKEYEELAWKKGFMFVASAPFVRSSYHAGEALGLAQ